MQKKSKIHSWTYLFFFPPSPCTCFTMNNSSIRWSWAGVSWQWLQWFMFVNLCTSSLMKSIVPMSSRRSRSLWYLFMVFIYGIYFRCFHTNNNLIYYIALFDLYNSLSAIAIMKFNYSFYNFVYLVKSSSWWPLVSF